MKKIVVLLIFCISGCAGMESSYQASTDLIRIKHIDTIVGLITEYQSKAGEFPFQSKITKDGVQVLVTHRRIPAAINNQTKTLPINSYSNQIFQEELSRVLERAVQLPSDPQKVATFAPNFYIYFVSRSQACVAGHLYTATADTFNVQNQYHKYQVCLPVKG
jgi:hypothetical protein